MTAADVALDRKGSRLWVAGDQHGHAVVAKVGLGRSLVGLLGKRLRSDR